MKTKFTLIWLTLMVALAPIGTHVYALEVAQQFFGFCPNEGRCTAIADVNGDGKDDIIYFVHRSSSEAAVFVALSTGSNFGDPILWHPYFCISGEICAADDVNGDGKADIVLFKPNAKGDFQGDVIVALSTGSNFGDPILWHPYFCIPGEICAVDDVNGDGKADIVLFKPNAKGDFRGDVIVALSTGSGFADATLWHPYFCIGKEICAVDDVNGDGKADIVLFKPNEKGDFRGDVVVALSTGSGFADATLWHPFFCIGKEICAVDDVNGDGKADIIAFVRNTQKRDGQGDVWVALSTGSGFAESSVWHGWFCIEKERCMTGDVNGDNRADVLLETWCKGKIYQVYVGLSSGDRFPQDQTAIWYERGICSIVPGTGQPRPSILVGSGSTTTQNGGTTTNPTPSLKVDVGLFITGVNWNTAPITTQGGKTIERTETSIVVKGPGGIAVGGPTGDRIPSYLIFGSNNYVLIKYIRPMPTGFDYSVTLVDFTGPSPVEKPITSGFANSMTVGPIIQYSQGSGSAFLVFTPTGSDVQGLGIYRSDNGELLCAGPGSFYQTSEIRGEATADRKLIIYYNWGKITCPIP